MSGMQIWRVITHSFFTGAKLKLEILFLTKSRKFFDDVEALGSIIPRMFAMDHFHYARWFSVHVRDLIQLDMNAPRFGMSLLEDILLHRKLLINSL